MAWWMPMIFVLAILAVAHWVPLPNTQPSVGSGSTSDHQLLLSAIHDIRDLCARGGQK